MKAIEQYLPGAVRILPGRGGGGGNSQKNWVGVCGPKSAIFPTLFMA